MMSGALVSFSKSTILWHGFGRNGR